MTKMNRTMKIIKGAMKLEKYMITLLMTSDSQVVIFEEKLNKNISPGSRHCLIVSQYFNLDLFHHFSFSLLPSLHFPSKM